MVLTQQQLEAIIAAALPGERYKRHTIMQPTRITIELVAGERVDLHCFETAQAATIAATALKRLRGEIDLPIPDLRATDTHGERVGLPYLITSSLAGEPLSQAVPRIANEQLHLIGQQLGRLAYRIHRLSCEHYGALASADGQTNERDYALARLEADLTTALEQQIIAEENATDLRAWFEQYFIPAGTVAALTCGHFSPETLLVRPGSNGWVLSGVLGWQSAVGWAAAWDHTILFDSARASAYFALRVGYGQAYDELTPRTYEQVREGILRPYRMLYALEQAIANHVANNIEERERHRRLLAALIRLEAS